MSKNGKQNKQRNLIIAVFCVMAFFVTTALLLDVFDVPSRLGFNCKDVNWSIQGTIIGSVITIGLFLITYLLIQRWDLRRQNNKQEIAVLLLKDAYTDCEKGLEVFEKSYYPELTMDKNDDNKKLIGDNVERFANSSFQNEPIIMDLCKDGVVSPEQLRHYFNVKTFYLQHFSLSIAIPDNTKLHEGTRELAKKEIEKALKSLEQDRQTTKRR